MRCENCKRILMQLEQSGVKPELWHSSCSMELHYLVFLLPVKQRNCVAPLLVVPNCHFFPKTDLQDECFCFYFRVTGAVHVTSLKGSDTTSSFNHAVFTSCCSPKTVDNCTVIKLSSPAQHVWPCTEAETTLEHTSLIAAVVQGFCHCLHVLYFWSCF